MFMEALPPRLARLPTPLLPPESIHSQYLCQYLRESAPRARVRAALRARTGGPTHTGALMLLLLLLLCGAAGLVAGRARRQGRAAEGPPQTLLLFGGAHS